MGGGEGRGEATTLQAVDARRDTAPMWLTDFQEKLEFQESMRTLPIFKCHKLNFKNI